MLDMYNTFLFLPTLKTAKPMGMKYILSIIKGIKLKIFWGQVIDSSRYLISELNTAAIHFKPKY